MGARFVCFWKVLFFGAPLAIWLIEDGMRWLDRIGYRLKLSDLHVLLAVAQQGSMSKAARQLSVSNPVVTRSIGQLEQTLGVRLFERTQRGVVITAHGRALVTHGRAAFNELRRGVEEIKSLDDPASGEIRIGTTPPLAASFVSAVIDRMARKYPKIIFHIVIGTGEAQRANLSERSVDLLIFRRTQYFFDEEIACETLFDSPYVVAAGARNPWVRRRKIELAELMSERWALPGPSDLFGPWVVEAFRASGLSVPHASVITPAFEMYANLLATNRYLAIIPGFWLEFPAPHPFIKRLPVPLRIAPEPISIISLKGRNVTAATRTFVECARDVAQRLVNRGR